MPSPPPMKRDPLRIEICRDADDLARHAAQVFVSIAGMSLGSRGRLDVALSGGEAARRMYDVLSQDHFAFQIVWPAVHVFWSDELCAPRDDAMNNRQHVESFLAKVGVAGSNIHPIGEKERLDLIVLDIVDALGAPAPEVIQAARAVMILASGETFAAAAQQVLGAGRQDDARALALRPANGQLVWLLDAEAASLLPLPETEGPPAEAGGGHPSRPDLSGS